MKPLYNQEDFIKCKSRELLPCECYQCGKTYFVTKNNIQKALSPNNKQTNNFCSRNCQCESRSTKKSIKCSNCDLEFEQIPSIIKKRKTGNYFCSQSCAATYNNKHKTTGSTRSKLEIWLEEQLTQLYPDLLMDFNKKDTIGSELDIYIPSLNVAFELNGLFHYEPTFGVDKLNKIQNNDKSKSKACIDNQIDLCIIDTSQQKYVKPSTSQKYLDIITNIINERI